MSVPSVGTARSVSSERSSLDEGVSSQPSNRYSNYAEWISMASRPAHNRLRSAVVLPIVTEAVDVKDVPR